MQEQLPQQQSEESFPEKLADDFYASHTLEIKHDYERFDRKDQEYRDTIMDIDKIIAAAGRPGVSEEKRAEADHAIRGTLVPRARLLLKEFAQMYKEFSEKWRPEIQLRVEKEAIHKRRGNMTRDQLREEIRMEIQKNDRIGEIERQFGITAEEESSITG